VVGDINNDGRADVVISDGTHVSWFSNSGPDTTGAWQGFGGATTISAAPASPGVLAIADVNKDGALDLIVGAPTGNKLLLNSSTTPGTFTADAAALGSGAVAIAVGDLNGDTYPDLVIASATATSVYLNAAVPNSTLGAALTDTSTSSATITLASVTGFPTSNG